MFKNRNPGSRRDKRNRCRNIKGAGSVSTGPADIHCMSGPLADFRIHRQFAESRRKRRHLGRGFTLPGERY